MSKLEPFTQFAPTPGDSSSSGESFRRRDVVSLLHASASISSKLDIDSVAQEVAKQLVTVLGVGLCEIVSWDADQGKLHTWTRFDFEDTGHQNLKITQLGGGAAARLYNLVAESLQPHQFRSDNPDANPDAYQLLVEANARTLLILPLLANNQVIGIIELYDRQRSHTFNQEDIAVAQLIANHAGIAIERARSLDASQKRAKQLEALYHSSLSQTTSLDLETTLNAVLESAISLQGDALDAHIFMYNGQLLQFGAALNADGHKQAPWAEPRQNGLTYTVARSGEMVVVPNIRQSKLFEGTSDEWKGSIIGIPLKIKDNVMGVMNVAYQHPRQFSDSELRVLGMLADQAAITIENARLHQLVRRQALTDALTALPNRRAFDLRLEDEISRAQRYENKMALVMMDFNDFKRVNDRYGHPAGDRMLRRFAVCMQNSVRRTDFLARYGGDEFVLLLPETDGKNAEILAQKLQRDLMQCTFDIKLGTSELVTLSYGVGAYPADGEDARTVLQVADQALYRAKDKFHNSKKDS
ncbi:MAG: diguanylate cyclase [Chloroflexi bacterium]|nr:MAG: diguanylate cyclase [Chloroflexota bacterium]MBL1193233.1 diguanylate cyclase [Chloroflexota bacterium]NOH10528.1 diguanylate cyclase [Chloroflexota bacterium]